MNPKNKLEILARPLALDPRFLASFFSYSDDADEEWWAIKTELQGPVAIVHARGVVGSWWFGFEAGDLAKAVEEAAATSRAVVLDLNSPGGVVDGVPEAAARIAAVGVPVVAHTAGMMCSAAYWLAAGANAITASTAAEVGSIGVYCPMVDYSAMCEKEGIKVELAKTGALKGAGFFGTPWTDEQKAHMQQMVDDIFEDFRGDVLKHRAGIPDEAMTGGAYMAKRAEGLGLVDAVGSLEEAVRLAERLGIAKQTAHQ